LIPELKNRPNQIWLDIGANIGAYSYYLSKFISNYEGKCIGFEPRKDLWLRLVKNVAASNFHAENYACSSENGYANIYLPTSHGLSLLVKMPEFDGLKYEKIQTVTLDSYAESNEINDIAFIKIDVEGHEFEVLNGARLTIKTHVPIVLFETENRHLHVQGKSTEEFIDMMKNLGYSAFVISVASLYFIQVDKRLIPQDRNGAEEYIANYWFIPNKLTNQICPKIELILNNLRASMTN
jgi:FkbM family methyltransferase